MNGLLSLIALPFHNRNTGAKLKANARNANRLLAHWKPSLVYILLLASGRKAAKIFSPRQTAADALAA